MQVKFLTGLVAGLFAAGIAIAQSTAPTPAATGQDTPTDKMTRPHHHGQRDRLVTLDQDKDGAISRAEAADHPMLSKWFDTIDGNKDGKLSKEEWQAQRQAMREKHRERADARFKQADRDGDGALSQQEAEAAARERAARMFERLDANKDGKLTQEEMRAGRKHGHGRHAQSRKPAAAS